jgi:hypothetical protein
VNMKISRESQSGEQLVVRPPSAVSWLPHTLKSLQASQSRSFSVYQFAVRGFGGRHAPTMSPRQLKEVIQVTHINVGSVASLGALVGGEVHR